MMITITRIQIIAFANFGVFLLSISFFARPAKAPPTIHPKKIDANATPIAAAPSISNSSNENIIKPAAAPNNPNINFFAVKQ